MLVGRVAEQQALDRLLADARTARSTALGIVGEPGIGKTTLLEELVARASDMEVLRARGVQSEMEVPFAGLAELLRPALTSLSRIPAPQADALAGSLALAPSVSQDRFAIGAATLSLLAAHAEQRPVLLVVDDAHLLDPSSAAALLFAARRLVADPIVMAFAARDGEPSLLDESDLPILHLGGLGPDEAARLLPDIGVDDVRRLYRATGGNPLALLELRREAATPSPLDQPVPLPARMANAFLRRFAELPMTTRRMLLLLATSDVRNVAVLARAAVQVGTTVEALEPAEEAGLVRIRDGRADFRHPLVRSAVYSAASGGDRRAAHAALAAALPDSDVDRRAWHLAAATVGPDDAVSDALTQAGLRAQKRSAYAIASGAFERAARFATQAATASSLLIDAARCAAADGQWGRTIELLDDVAPTDATTQARVDALRGHVALRRGPVMAAYELLGSAAEHFAPTEPEVALSLVAEQSHAAFVAGDAAALAAAAHRASELTQTARTVDAELWATMSQAMALVLAGDGQRGAARARRAIEIFGDLPALPDEPRLLLWATLAPLWVREAETGRELMARAVQQVRQRSAMGLLPYLLNPIARDQATTDEWAAADASYDEAVRLARETGQRVELGSLLAGWAWLEARQGREPQCRTHLEEGAAICSELGLGFYGIWCQQAHGYLELALGRPAQAAERFAEQLAAMTERDIVDVDLSPAPELVEAYLRLDRVADAEAIAQTYVAAAEAKGQPWAAARALRCQALLASAEDAPELFERALVMHARTPDVFETARTELSFGARLRRNRRRVDSRERLHAALDTFSRLGAQAWVDQTSAELAATGETARARDVTTLVQLTPQEFQIARLLSGGATTREAAAATFLSPKTIEYHLRSVYRKLGVHSRQELAEVIGGRPGQRH